MRQNLKYTQLMYPDSIGHEIIMLPQSTNEEDLKNIAGFLTPKIVYINIDQNIWKTKSSAVFRSSHLLLKEVYKKPLNVETDEGYIDFIKYLIKPLLEERDKTVTWVNYYKLNTENMDDISIKRINDILNPVDNFTKWFLKEKNSYKPLSNVIFVPYPESLIPKFSIIQPVEVPDSFYYKPEFIF